MKYIRLLAFSALLIVCTSAALKSCSKAAVSCTQVERFQSSEGVLNIPQFAIGDVIVLDTVHKVGQYMLHTNLTDDHLSASTPIDSVVLLRSTGFEIALSGKISKASQNIQASAKTTISNNTTFFMSNFVRKNIINPSNGINGAQSFNSIKTALERNPNTICMYISSMIYADHFQFRLRKADNINADASIVTVGNFNVKVDYMCEGSVQLDAKRGGVFFKGTTFIVNADKTQLVQYVRDIDLTKYSLVHAIL